MPAAFVGTAVEVAVEIGFDENTKAAIANVVEDRRASADEDVIDGGGERRAGAAYARGGVFVEGGRHAHFATVTAETVSFSL